MERLRLIHQDLDGLRLAALGRIPRCPDCPRYLALVGAHRSSAAVRLPQPPAGCGFQVCAPLAERYGTEAETPRAVA